jgi:hypothetical protein
MPSVRRNQRVKWLWSANPVAGGDLGDRRTRRQPASGLAEPDLAQVGAGATPYRSRNWRYSWKRLNPTARARSSALRSSANPSCSRSRTRHSAPPSDSVGAAQQQRGQPPQPPSQRPVGHRGLGEQWQAGASALGVGEDVGDQVGPQVEHGVGEPVAPGGVPVVGIVGVEGHDHAGGAGPRAAPTAERLHALLGHTEQVRVVAVAVIDVPHEVGPHGLDGQVRQPPVLRPLHQPVGGPRPAAGRTNVQDQDLMLSLWVGRSCCYRRESRGALRHQARHRRP